MATGNLSAGSRGAQTWQASGESTPSAKLPDEYVSNPVPTSPIAGHLTPPTDHTSFVPGQPNAVVRRWPRMNGMRYLYASGATKMPIRRMGADGIPYPWNSSYQPNLHGPIHNAGFNDALFQAGYPGFNLGLSFKVPTVDRTASLRSTMNNQRLVSSQPESVAVQALRRVTGAPNERKAQ